MTKKIQLSRPVCSGTAAGQVFSPLKALYGNPLKALYGNPLKALTEGGLSSIRINPDGNLECLVILINRCQVNCL